MCDDEITRVEALSRFATRQTAAEMYWAVQAAFATSPSSDKAACIDPQLLNYRNQNAVTSPSPANVISTIGNNLAMPSVVSDETTAGRG
jgi:hypothetical protein